jgi:endonuclease/exonuclease/phosphatase family metal-dependent hydrolase
MTSSRADRPEVRRNQDTEATAGASVIRVLTLNAHQGFNALRRRNLLTRIRDGLRAHGADLVFLQEVGGEGEPEGPAHHYEVLADQVWPQYAYGRNAVTSSGHQGNAPLSKYPILSWENIDTSVGRSEPRGMLHCVVDAPEGRPLHAVCVHFGLREAHRRLQVERLLELIGRTIPEDAPLVIAGDFNDWRGRVHRRLKDEPSLEEIYACANGDPARTFPRAVRFGSIGSPSQPAPPPHRRASMGMLSDHLPLAGERIPKLTSTIQS